MPRSFTGNRLRKLLLLVSLLATSASVTRLFASPQQAQPLRIAVGPNVMQLEADQQHKEGNIYFADGNVVVQEDTMHIQAQHIEYNSTTFHVIARAYDSWQPSKLYYPGSIVQPSPPNGHIYVSQAQGTSGAMQPTFPTAGGQTIIDGPLIWKEAGAVKTGPAVIFDDGLHHLEAERVDYDVRAGTGHFEKVHGSVHTLRPPNPLILVTTNPIVFDAKSVDRLDEDTYRIHHARLTICDPARPTWTFSASESTLHVNDRVAMINADFRILRVPLIYLPYTSIPTGHQQRQSGFLLPEIAENSVKGYILADSYYWAPVDWADATVGAQLLSKRGWSQHLDTRMLPTDNVTVSATYFGVVDREHQGGHLASGLMTANLPDGWRAVIVANQLTSLLFQEVFANTFSIAINSEVHNDAFLTNNFGGFSLNFDISDFKDFVTVQPQTTLTVRSAPQGRFSSVDQAPWRNVPLYFGFDVYSGFVHRADPSVDTRGFIDRSQMAPRVTLPLHLGSWLGVTPSYIVDVRRYGAEEVDGNIIDTSLWQTAREFSVDITPPTLERTWNHTSTTWKHTIEPRIVYSYVAGINNFANILRIDQEDTVTDTNEIEYSITQRLFRRNNKTGVSDDILSWTLLEKYYFDPTFGHALIPGVRNVFEALDSVTPFAFADGQRSISPLVSDFKFMPGGRAEAEFRTDYDPVRKRITATEALFRTRLTSTLNLSFAQYAIDATPVLEPLSNQVRATLSYSSLNRKGWNAASTFSYDVKTGIPQYETFQGGYNSNCCGISFQYQRISLGQIINANEFRVAFTLANIGSFGTLRRQDAVGAVF